MSFIELSKPRLMKVNLSLARKFRDMERFPKDRDLKPSILEYLRAAIKEGEFRGAEWVAAYCKQTGLTYRLNGKHTSTLLTEFLEAGKEVEAHMLVREYECETLEDVARLYATFDSRQSARSKSDVIRGYANANPALAELSTRLLSLATAALAWDKWEHRGYLHDAAEQSSLLIENVDYVCWLAELLSSGSNSRSRCKHMYRMSVAAAMVRTYRKSKSASTEFWTMIRDDCDLAKDSAPRKLFRWLLTHSIAKGTQTHKEPAGQREVFVRCLVGWNAWRRNKSTDLKYYPEKPIPAVV